MALLAGSGPVRADPASDGIGIEAPVPITSDTRAFCERLAVRVRTAPGQTPETTHLLELGDAMCRQGAVREGLFRLREAWMIEHDNASASSGPPRVAAPVGAGAARSR